MQRLGGRSMLHQRLGRESSVAGAERVRERVKNDEMEEAGRGPSVWDFVEHDKDLGFYFKCKGRSHWQTHSSYWVQKD